MGVIMSLFKNKYRIESARLKEWDYRNVGYYFVTICTSNRRHYFGQILDGEMHLSALGEIATCYWQEIPQHHAHVELDEFVVMPDHVHGIVVIREKIVETFHVKTFHGTSLRKMSAISPKRGSLGVIIRSYKSAVSRWAGLNGYQDFVWQPRFYDHIIHNDESLNKIRRYISNNPEGWAVDKENTANLYM